MENKHKPINAGDTLIIYKINDNGTIKILVPMTQKDWINDFSVSKDNIIVIGNYTIFQYLYKDNQCKLLDKFDNLANFNEILFYDSHKLAMSRACYTCDKAGTKVAIFDLDTNLVNSDSLDKKIILETFKKVGKVKLLIVAGIFIKNKDSRVDLLIVGDKMSRAKIEEGIRKLEAEIGAELSYAIFDTKEFNYRMNMYDKLVRDIIDFPYEVILETKELNLAKVVI